MDIFALGRVKESGGGGGGVGRYFLPHLKILAGYVYDVGLSVLVYFNFKGNKWLRAELSFGSTS